jgi:hypothetical protein
VDPWALAVDELDGVGYPASDKARWLADPVVWAHERCSVAELWLKQREALRAVRDHRRVAVHSCHSTGKTFDAGVITAWWIDAHPPGQAFVVTTAPTGHQVKAQLWREINRLHTRGELPGRTNLTEWYLGGELVAFGRKPSEYNESAFQGTHARYILVVLDEACGIPSSLWVAAESIASAKNGHILAIGNPDINDGDFANVCAEDSSWHVIHVGYEHVRDDPDISDELREVLISERWVEERRDDWGEDSALFQSKCLGLFPRPETDPWTVVPLAMATRCRYNELAAGDDDPHEGGIDIGAGGDRTVLVERHGPRAGRIEAFQNPDPMETVGQLIRAINEWDLMRVKIDVIGVGWGLYGRLKELSAAHNPTGECEHLAEVVPVDFRRRSSNPRRFINLRAEVWWNVGRERSRLGTWNLATLDDAAIGELTTPRYVIMDSRGQIKIEAKDEVIKRLKRSPDVADALLLAFYDGASARPVNTDAVETFAGANIMGGTDRGLSPFGSGQRFSGGGGTVFGSR